MYFKFTTAGYIFWLFFAACTNGSDSENSAAGSSWIKPEAGSRFKIGDRVELKTEIADSSGVDSVVYLADGERVGKSAKGFSSTLATDSLKPGSRLITAKIYRQSQSEEISTNIILTSDIIPQKFTYRRIQVFNHDTSSYTQGLEYHEGYFYESDGGNTPETGYSSLRKVEPSTGRVLQKADLPQEIFAEGLTVVDDKVIQLTWQNRVGLVFDRATFNKLSEFPYQNSAEGWGLASDSKRLYKSDGTNQIFFLNRKSYREEGSIEVYDHNGPVDQLNELEIIDGKIYANVYLTDRIVIIDPQSGKVTGEIDLSGLLPDIYKYPGTDVLNGIAWDAKGKRLFVTGKRWAKLFEVNLIETQNKL